MYVVSQMEAGQRALSVAALRRLERAGIGMKIMQPTGRQSVTVIEHTSSVPVFHADADDMPEVYATTYEVEWRSYGWAHTMMVPTKTAGAVVLALSAHGWDVYETRPALSKGTPSLKRLRDWYRQRCRNQNTFPRPCAWNDLRGDSRKAANAQRRWHAQVNRRLQNMGTVALRRLWRAAVGVPSVLPPRVPVRAMAAAVVAVDVKRRQLYLMQREMQTTAHTVCDGALMLHAWECVAGPLSTLPRNEAYNEHCNR